LFIKICGIRDVETAEFLIELGIDAMGFVFSEKSPRYISPKKAKDIIGEVKGKILVVGVFKSREEIKRHEEIIQEVVMIQTYEEVYIKGKKIILGVRGATSFNADFYLIDFSMGRGVFTELPDDLFGYPREKVIISGGLNPRNVSDVIRRYKPFGVDVSSGVEEAPGVKSKKLIVDFVENIRRGIK